MTSLKHLRRHYALIGVSILLLIPIAMAAFAPFLAPIPSEAAGWTASPLPQRDEPLPGFQHLLDPLPLVVRDLPDEASQEVVAIYEATSFTDNQSAMRMVTVAGDAIVLPANLRSSWQSWLSSPQPSDVPTSVMAHLQKDPRNADRLSNLAVAMYFSWTTAIRPGAYDLDNAAFYRSMELLETAVASFPESRAPILNYMSIRSASWQGEKLESQATSFDEWLMSHPDDETALQLAVRIFVNGGLWGYEQDPHVLRTLATQMSESDDPARSALGHALLGDIELGDLGLAQSLPFAKKERAPFSVMHSARVALEHYDKALALSDDPSLYSARALALELLGDIPAAIESQQRAVDFIPDSISLRLQLADLALQERGTTAQVRKSIETARTIEREAISITVGRAMPSLSEVRMIRSTAELAGLSANRPDRFYVYYSSPTAGAGYLVAFDQIPLYEHRPEVTSSQNPVIRAITNTVLKSEALGDADGLTEDVALQQAFSEGTIWPNYSYEPQVGVSVHVARLVADPDTVFHVDLDSNDVSDAAAWLRFAGANEEAIELCHTALQLGDDAAYPDDMHLCIAENAYLIGDYEMSQDAFEAVGDDFMVGYVAERRGNLDEAMRRYRLVAQSDAPSRYIAMVRLATVLLETGAPEEAIIFYDEFLKWATDDMACRLDLCIAVANVRPLAQSNRGVAQLQTLAGDNGTIDCEGVAWEACTEAFTDFTFALESDPYNPTFLMNKAWVSRLLGDRELSSQLMAQVLASDPSIYPVLNDSGVLAAEAGDSSAASQYFLDAVAANPHYDLALWNLGVLNMQQGIPGIFRGQAWLARAILQNPSLMTESLGFRTDERVYRVEINERLRPGAGWSFGVASSVATAAFGFFTIVLVIFHATYLVVRDKLLEIMYSTVEKRAEWIRQRIPLGLLLRVNDRWALWLPLAAALVVLAITTTWLSRHGEPNAPAASATLSLFAVALAVVTHELGHALAANRMHAVVRPAQWMPGTVLALGLLPLGLSSGPFPGQKVVAESEAESKRVYLSGPLANLAVAIVFYLLFTMQPLPGLRLISQVQLAAMGYALLPFAPLDGAVLARAHPRLLAVLGGTALLLGVLFAVGIL